MPTFVPPASGIDAPLGGATPASVQTASAEGPAIDARPASEPHPSAEVPAASGGVRADDGAGTSAPPLTRLGGWGRCPTVEAREVASEDLERITRDAVLTRGLGRSYGDASLPPAGGKLVACSRLADRVIALDERTGLLSAEAGLSLHAMNRLLLPRGWFTPVSPGTQFVTLGGMVAADVHGKNHHAAGSFGAHVRRVRLRTGGGRVLDVSPAHEPELFRATVGGMGLTGHMLEVDVQLERIASPWIWSESEQVPDLDRLVERLVDAGKTWPYTVAWADCFGRGRSFGRGTVISGRWAEPGEAPARGPSWKGALGVPLTLPNWALNDLGLRVLNTGKYLAHGSRVRRGIVHPEAFFYPLDVIQNWNRIYGARGFIQYQCALPPGAPYRKLFEIMHKHDSDPYLCVVKDFGAEGLGTISFPRPGLTFALDFPMRGETTRRLVDAMNDFVAGEGGRVYLAKDAFTRREHFAAMEPRAAGFDAVRRAWDPEGRIVSMQSVRLFGDDADGLRAAGRGGRA